VLGGVALSADGSSGRRAVVTGIGVVTPVGRGIEEFFSALCAPTSGLVRPPEGRPAVRYSYHIDPGGLRG
jgi:3-oxoacyl-(acyl-carrier-protein) synthase